MAGEIYFAWATSDDTTFSETFAVEDEDVFSFEINHDEGQMPTLDVVIQYPKVAGVAAGLLSASRNQWCWLSWQQDADTVVPLFYGRLIGFPSNLNDTLVTLQFVARAKDYISQKQTLADGLKVRPYYDPVFLSDEALNDPDSILEGYSAAYHVDRTSLEWTISDILVGEDGTVVFDGDDVLNGSISIDVKEAPLRAIRVDASVNWKQNFRGTQIPVDFSVIKTLTAKSLADSWPKIGTSLGGGWRTSVGTYAFTSDDEPTVYTEHGSFQDINRKHADGDCIGATWNATIPSGDGFIVNRKQEATYGSIGGGVNFLTSPPGTISSGEQQSNTSSSINISYTLVARGTVATSLVIEPDGDSNDFVETLSLTISSDMQPLLSDATAEEETEVLTLSGANVGEAAIDYKAWSSLTTVQRGQICRPNLSPGPGGTSFQIAITSGTVSGTQPLMSDVVGEETVDGTVTWACIGTSLPTIGDWQQNVFVKVGSVICYEAGGGYFFVCTQEGFTGSTPPTFNNTAGTVTVDGGAEWTSLASGGPSFVVPIGGQPGNITQSAFFDQDRGAAAVEYMIMRARARMRTRARAVEIRFRVPFASAVSLSCRKNVSLTVPKIIPNGTATGKVISYRLARDGATGDFVADVTIGCAVGEGTGDAANVAGTPVYVSDEALGPDTQIFEGKSDVFGAGDISYSPPPPDSTFNGFTYPLTRDQVVLASGWMGSLATQEALVKQTLAEPNEFTGRFVQGAVGSAQAAKRAKDRAQALLNSEAGSIYYELWLRPITGQSTERPYVVNVSKLTIPKQVNLGAA